MAEHVIYLKLPERKPAAMTAATPSICIGRQYQLSDDEPVGELHGLCGGLDYSSGHGRIINASQDHPCFLWDIDEEITEEELTLRTAESESITLNPLTNIVTSHFVMSHGALSEPQIIERAEIPQLTTTASFEFIFHTSLPAVRLGVINLVQTQRFAPLKNGTQHTLLNRGEEQPVLYLGGDTGEDAVPATILDTVANTVPLPHTHAITLTQSLPDTLDGTELESLTVLEQYTSYFMQRELPFSTANIWTPVCAPVTWGWSMRVTKRKDGDWCIVRQKLLMPTVGHNGFELPVWEGNQLDR